MKRSLANGGFVVSSHVDHRHGNARGFEAVPQFDAGRIAQVDVEQDANRISEIVVVCKGIRRRKQQADVAELPQQSRYAPQHCGVVIDDNNLVANRQRKTAQ